MARIQIKIENSIKNKADKVLGKNGLSTQGAIKILLYSVAISGKTPFNDLFN